MKYIILILLMAINCYAGQMSSSLNGLNILIHMNEQSGAKTINEIDKTSTTIVSASWVTGRFGSGLYFAGAGYIKIDDNVNLRPGTNAYSVTLWFNYPNTNSNSALFGKRNTASPYEDFGLYFCNDSANNPGKRLQLCDRQDNTTKIHKVTSNYYADAKWHFCVATRDLTGKATRLYIDGKEITDWAESIIGGTYPPNIINTFPLLVGSLSVGVLPAIGTVDEFAVWLKTLSQGEVMQLYLDGVGSHRCEN